MCQIQIGFAGFRSRYVRYLHIQTGERRFRAFIAGAVFRKPRCEVIDSPVHAAEHFAAERFMVACIHRVAHCDDRIKKRTTRYAHRIGKVVRRPLLRLNKPQR